MCTRVRECIGSTLRQEKGRKFLIESAGKILSKLTIKGGTNGRGAWSSVGNTFGSRRIVCGDVLDLVGAWLGGGPMKNRLDLLPPKAVKEVGEVLTFGETKHPGQPWKQMQPNEDHVAAALRHIMEHLDGTTLDSESGRLHLAHAAARLLFAVQLFKAD